MDRGYNSIIKLKKQETNSILSMQYTRIFLESKKEKIALFVLCAKVYNFINENN